MASIVSLDDWKLRKCARKINLSPRETELFLQCKPLQERVKFYLAEPAPKYEPLQEITIYLDGMPYITRSFNDQASNNEVSIYYENRCKGIENAGIIEVTINNRLVYLAILGTVIIHVYKLELYDYLMLLVDD